MKLYHGDGTTICSETRVNIFEPTCTLAEVMAVARKFGGKNYERDVQISLHLVNENISQEEE